MTTLLFPLVQLLNDWPSSSILVLFIRCHGLFILILIFPGFFFPSPFTHYIHFFFWTCGWFVLYLYFALKSPLPPPKEFVELIRPVFFWVGAFFFLAFILHSDSLYSPSIFMFATVPQPSSLLTFMYVQSPRDWKVHQFGHLTVYEHPHLPLPASTYVLELLFPHFYTLCFFITFYLWTPKEGISSSYNWILFLPSRSLVFCLVWYRNLLLFSTTTIPHLSFPSSSYRFF